MPSDVFYYLSPTKDPDDRGFHLVPWLMLFFFLKRRTFSALRYTFMTFWEFSFWSFCENTLQCQWMNNTSTWFIFSLQALSRYLVTIRSSSHENMFVGNHLLKCFFCQILYLIVCCLKFLFRDQIFNTPSYTGKILDHEYSKAWLGWTEYCVVQS